MTRIDESMVVKRAKAHSEQDGFTWYVEVARGRPLSEARRRLYLAKARAELCGEADV